MPLIIIQQKIESDKKIFERNRLGRKLVCGSEVAGNCYHLK